MFRNQINESLSPIRGSGGGKFPSSGGVTAIAVGVVFVDLNYRLVQQPFQNDRFFFLNTAKIGV